MRRVMVDPDAPQRDAIAEAAKWIAQGRVVALATDTLYGLAADPFRADAVARVFDVKGRAADRALPLIASGVEQVVAQIGALSSLATRLADRYWPGPLTLLLPAPAALARDVTGGTGKVGVRVPAYAIARDVCAVSGRVITATSANRSGEPPTADPDAVERLLGDRVDFLLDTGPARGGAPSTIVDVTGAAPLLVRPGAISWDEIQAWLYTARA